jgi:hypothetical protein
LAVDGNLSERLTLSLQGMIVYGENSPGDCAKKIVLLRSNDRMLGVADVTSLNVGTSRAAVHEPAMLIGAR